MQALSPPALVAAIEANQCEFVSRLRHWPPAEVHDDPEVLWSITNIPGAIFNSVLRARISSGRVDAVIEETIARGRERSVPLLWWVGPDSRPANLGPRLLAHGFALDASLLGMAAELTMLDPAPVGPIGLAIETVADDGTLRTWCNVLAAGFGMPDFLADAFFSLFRSLGYAMPSLRNYIGWLDGHAVATSTLFLGAGVAGIYDVATIPGARRKGIGAAVTARGLLDARAMGYRTAVLQASALGAGVYRNLGFVEQCVTEHYVWGGASAQAS